jgi:predicted helicase
MPIKSYLQTLSAALKQGNATEHTHRPGLKKLVEDLAKGITATNEPKRIACGAPDYIVTRGVVPIGYIEAKDVDASLDEVESSEQLKRYRSSLRNLILTNYLEFRLYRNGEHVHTASLGKLQKNGVLKANTDEVEPLQRLLQNFYEGEVSSVSSPKELAQRMAMLARMVHDIILKAMEQSSDGDDLYGQYEAFKQVLIHELSPAEFADMYAQTISYGLFAARCNHQSGAFTRQSAGADLPKTNPFLRKLFNNIAGADLDDRIAWAVDDLAELLARADMAAVLQDFGRATKQEDPVVHFYETFLAAYDPRLRESRGVYYTPEPVVSYIVRSVDAILKREFKLPAGLADQSKVKINNPQRLQDKENKKGKSKASETREVHRVQILDPACGTGTFLHAVIAQIKQSFAGNAGMWPGYVAEHLLPRLFGFELLMAPYAVAHMKLGLQLKESGYDFASDERLKIFLTNTLEQAHEMTGLPLFTQWLADEAAAADAVKRDVPIMVVLGNPPYSGHSSNKGKWIANLLDEYKKSAELKKPGQGKWINDDYVKFIRFAQWRIEQTGHGVLAFVTNHSYLDNPTFLDMRESLLKTFDNIYLLDLHGNSKKKEKSPDGSKDENVFDIQQGVAICLMVRKPRAAALEIPNRIIHHANIWGARASKYEWLYEHSIESTKWHEIKVTSPQYLFAYQDAVVKAEYDAIWSLREILNQNGDPAPGIVTTHDDFAISWSKEVAISKVEKLLKTKSETEARELFDLCTQNQWNYERAKAELADGAWRNLVVPILYRPFDMRWTVYDRNVAVHRRERVMQEMLQPNLCLLLPRQTKNNWSVLTTDSVAGHKSASVYDISSAFPLYLYPREKQDLLDNPSTEKRANFSPEFLQEVKSKLGKVSPEALFAYIYAVLYSPAYRARYAEFLKRDFPRVPLTADRKRFDALAALGQALIDLHTMRVHAKTVCTYPVAGNNRVDKVEYRQDAESSTAPDNGRLHINKEQYFADVPEAVWNYHIGGYQVAHKWLKDRKGRLLTFDDLQHYQHVLAALAETIRLQTEIDKFIPAWPMS